jgi:RNA recognition motif-containing protein
MDIYVGNLSPEITDEDLRKAFEIFGQVLNITLIKDKYSGRLRGFGFIKMSDDEEAQFAINGMNGKEIKGRVLKVNEARPRMGDRRRGSDRRGKNRGIDRRRGERRTGDWHTRY